jgi:hypothetical protein
VIGASHLSTHPYFVFRNCVSSMSNASAGGPGASATIQRRPLAHRVSSSSYRFSSCLCFVPANQFSAECQEYARNNEAAGMTRRDAKLRSDLAKRQAESPKAMNRQ